ncbi:MAG: SRPBCC family protein [Rhodocyclaceae bacterium]|nr:SRPBCC family protein [Rhodocyclaceae bacterium]
MGTVSLYRVVRAPAERIFRAFVDPDALVKWLPPHGFTARIEHLDATPGGSFRMAFTNFTTRQTHAFGGTYLEVVDGERLCYTDTFDDPSLPGQMITTVSLQAVPGGTALSIVQEGIPEAIPESACHLGWQASLELLVRLVEAAVEE